MIEVVRITPVPSPVSLGCSKVEERSFLLAFLYAFLRFLLGLFRSLSSILSRDDSLKFVSNELSAFVGTNSVASEADGLLLLGSVASLEQLHHLALEG